MRSLAEHLASWIHDEVTVSGGTGVVFGVSGGVDSAVVAAIAARAFPRAALGVLMPCHSDPRDAEDGELVARHFGIDHVTVDLGPLFDSFVEALARVSPGLPASRLATGNLKPRLRMTTLYALANERDSFVVGSSNRSELTVGYFTKYGDSGVDLLPLGNLVKHEVWDLAQALGVPERIVKRVPTAGLWPGQSDEADLGVTYKELDTYLLSGLGSEDLRARVDALRTASEHKRAMPRIAPRQGL